MSIDTTTNEQKKNEILLRRKNKVIVKKDNEPIRTNHQYVVTIMKNIETIGYTFSKELYEALLTLTVEEIKAFYLELITILKKQIGADVKYNPMYPNFPASVMERTEAELYVNAIVHYWTGGVLYPAENKNERLPLFEETKVKVISLGSEQDIDEIFYNLCQSKTSISQEDKEDLTWIFTNRQANAQSVMNDIQEIPLKENAALIGKLYLENNPLAKALELQQLFHTATDVLRLITAMSDGDVSLAADTRFRSFKRRERRILMELLQNCGTIEEDMFRYKNRWIRVGERLHPSEYNKEQYDKVITAFYKLRNNEKIGTFTGKVTKAIESGEYRQALLLLKKRPGEFARRLDYLLRQNTEEITMKTEEYKNLVVNTFKEVAGSISTPVLLQVKEHFAHRMEKPEVRVFFPKGSLSRSHCIDNQLPDIEEKYCNAIVSICENALLEEYKKKDYMGNVYISEELKRYIVPFSQRSASKALKTIVRGSSIPIADHTKVLRGFVWWTNMPKKKGIGSDLCRVDIDLSAAIFDDNWNYMEHLSYTNLRSEQYKSCHSGDIVNGGPVDGEGVSEFIDVDIASVVKYGARYVVYQVYSYTRQPFSELPHAMFGWMGREEVNSGDIYEPKAVEQKMDIASMSTVCIPVIFDCLERKMIWCDMNLSLNACRRNYGGNNVESNLSGVAATCYSMVNMRKPNLYDLIDLHIRARGHRVKDREEADIVFDVESGITPFDTDIIVAEYL